MTGRETCFERAMFSSTKSACSAPGCQTTTPFSRAYSRALPRFGEQGASGSLTVSRPNELPGITVHVSPVGQKEIDFRPWSVAALVLVIDHAPTRIDPAFVETVLGLTPAESQIAVLLAEGRTPRDIAAMTGRKERTVRWHVQQIFEKRGISRQVDLVRQVLSLASPSDPQS